MLISIYIHTNIANNILESGSNITLGGGFGLHFSLYLKLNYILLIHHCDLLSTER